MTKAFIGSDFFLRGPTSLWTANKWQLIRVSKLQHSHTRTYDIQTHTSMCIETPHSMCRCTQLIDAFVRFDADRWIIHIPSLSHCFIFFSSRFHSPIRYTRRTVCDTHAYTQIDNVKHTKYTTSISTINAANDDLESMLPWQRQSTHFTHQSRTTSRIFKKKRNKTHTNSDYKEYICTKRACL